jgi:hypothetical protein
MTCINDDRGKSRRSGAADQDGRTGQVLNGQAIERLDGAVCSLHHAHEDEKLRFHGWASKPVATVFSDLTSKPVAMGFSGLASKPMVTVSPVFASKPVAQVSRFGPQNWQVRFGDLDFKITTTVSWFEPQNQTGFGLSVASQNRWREDGTGHTSRSDGLLRLKVSRARVFHSGLKTGRCTMVGGARGIIVEVT